MPRKGRLSKFEMEALEKRARGMAAWGMYAVYTQQQNLNRECQDLRHRLKSNGASTREIDEQVKQLERERVAGAHHLIIGG
jgi:hypothetical protein